MLGAANTAELVTYQQKGSALPMFPHGHPDPATLVSQGLYDPAVHWTEKPSALRRDLQGVSNSIPQWAWLSFGGLFLVLGIVAYRRQRK